MPRDRHPAHVVVHVAPPYLHHLRRIVPTGQTQDYHDVEVLALALEVYDAGVMDTCRIQALGTGPDLGDADAAERSAHLALTAPDNRDGHPSFSPGRPSTALKSSVGWV